MCFPFRTKIAKILCLNWNILLGWHTRYWWHNDLLKSKKKYINSNKGKIDSIWFNAATSGILSGRRGIARLFRAQSRGRHVKNRVFISNNWNHGIFQYWTLVALAAREMGHVSSENINRRIAIRRSEIDRDVNFAKKISNFVKMNTGSINLTENPSDFVESYFKKKPELLVIVPYSVNFVKKTLDFVKIIMKSINFMKNPLNFSVIDRYSVDAKFTK